MKEDLKEVMDDSLVNTGVDLGGAEARTDLTADQDRDLGKDLKVNHPGRDPDQEVEIEIRGREEEVNFQPRDQGLHLQLRVLDPDPAIVVTVPDQIQEEEPVPDPNLENLKIIINLLMTILKRIQRKKVSILSFLAPLQQTATPSMEAWSSTHNLQKPENLRKSGDCMFLR